MPTEEKKKRKVERNKVNTRIQVVNHAITLMPTYLLETDHLQEASHKIRRKGSASQMRMIVPSMGQRTSGVIITRTNMVTTSDPSANPQEIQIVPISQAPPRLVTPPEIIPIT